MLSIYISTRTNVVSIESRIHDKIETVDTKIFSNVQLVFAYKIININHLNQFSARNGVSICHATPFTATSHEGYDGTNQRQIQCLFNRLFRPWTKEVTKLYINTIFREIHRSSCAFPHKGRGQKFAIIALMSVAISGSALFCMIIAIVISHKYT